MPPLLPSEAMDLQELPLHPERGDEPPIATPHKGTSALAVTSLVLSCVFCCPLTTIAGVITGLIAFFITRPGTGVGGRWLAIAAIIIGVSATTLQGVVAAWGWDAVMMPIFTGPKAALTAGMSGDVAAMQRAFAATSSDGNTEANAAKFCEELSRRYGAFESAALIDDSMGSRPPTAGKDFAGEYSLTFAKGTMKARCSIEIATRTGQLSMRITELVIEDATLGDLRYPPEEPEGPEQDEKGASEGNNGDR